jgi:hypothetical protein
MRITIGFARTLKSAANLGKFRFVTVVLHRFLISETAQIEDLRGGFDEMLGNGRSPAL